MNLFSGSYENGAAGGQGGAASRRGKKRTLEELFKPPIDIIFKGDLQTARDSATSAKKWLLVNIQDACEFQCQVLNRDVWSNEAVKTILREHFIFWQVSKKVFCLFAVSSKVKSVPVYRPLAYFSDIFISCKNDVISQQT